MGSSKPKTWGLWYALVVFSLVFNIDQNYVILTHFYKKWTTILESGITEIFTLSLTWPLFNRRP